MSGKVSFILLLALPTAGASYAQDVLSPDYGRAPSTEYRQGAARGQAMGGTRLSGSAPRNSSTPRYGTTQRDAEETPFEFESAERAPQPAGRIESPRRLASPSEAATETRGRSMAAIEPANLPLKRSEQIRAQHFEQEGEYGAAQASHAEPAGDQSTALAITPRRGDAHARDDAASMHAPNSTLGGWGSLPGVMASLGFVLGLFFLVAWLMRRGMPGTIPTLSKSVVEVLGRVPMAGRQQMQLLRVGNKLILVHMSLTGVETLTEIDDPAEVDRIAGLCQQGQSHSSTRVFHDMLDQMGREHRAAEFVDQDHGVELVSSVRGKRRDLHGRDRRV